MRFTKINTTLLYLLLAFGLKANAQDSLSVWNINRTLVAQQDYALTTSSGLFLIQSPILRTSFSLLNYDQFGGDFKLAQQGKSNNRISFSSEGIRTLKKLKMWGSFKYQFEQNDSIRFSHRVDNTDPAPFYYGSEKGVHYTRTDYQINTLVTHPLMKGISGGIGMDYGMGDHFSTNDPRAALKHFRMVFKPELIYHKAEFALGLNGTYGYGQNEYQVDYRNKAYYESESYPEYLNYLVNGYGIIRDALDFSDRVFMINRKWKGAGIDGQVKLGDGTLKGRINYLLREEKFERGNSSGKYASRENYGEFNLDKWESMFKYINQSWSATLSWQKEEGKEHNTRLGGNNYLYHEEQINFNLMHTRMHESKKLEFGLLMSAKNANQVDGNYEIQRDRSQLSAGLMAGREWINTKDHNFITRVSTSYYLPINTEFKYNPDKLNSFITQVILPDAVMDKQRFAMINASAHYMMRQKSLFWKFGVDGKYIVANDPSQIYGALRYLPGNNAYGLNLSVALFF